MKARIYVTLKEEVLDPQGDAVRRALGSLGFKGITNVRVGKLIEIDIDRSDAAAVERDVSSFGAKLLANPVIEDFRFEMD